MLTVACGKMVHITAHVFYEDLAAISDSFDPSLLLMQKGRYFVKRAYCLLTSQIAASPELNKFNIYLR